MKVVVLGASGMLGQRVSDRLSSSGFEVVRVSRSTGLKFDFENQHFADFAESIKIGGSDWVINCVGWIPQKSSGNTSLDRARAKSLNSRLPAEISASKSELGFAWLQIATDCVFDGSAGGYLETSSQRATDLYSETKIAGERVYSNATQVRTSIIGADSAQKSGLYEWFKALPLNAIVDGYANHLWSGVTTNSFANLAAGLVRSDLREQISQHWIPLGSASKYELLLLFRKYLNRDDIKILPVEHTQQIDRTLSSSNPEGSDAFWTLAGYSRPQTIEELVREMVASDSHNGKFDSE